MKRAAILLASAAFLALVFVRPWPVFSGDPPAATGTLPTKIRSDLLPNAYRLTDKVISGGQPDGDAAFAELRKLSVQTIISVDGAKPDVIAAKKYGLRYVHLPHGYDGIADARLMELAKAVRDLPDPIYVHCHHGKHRSPAAAAAACVVIGALGSGDALAVLKAAGTSPNYRGLYDTVASAKKQNPKVLDVLVADFRETVAVPPLADAMVSIEHAHDHLKEISAAGWKAPPRHPDLDPPHEALLLKEQYAELLRTDLVARQPERFKDYVRESEVAADELETALRTSPPDEKRMTAALGKISAACQSCHQAFRDTPLREKAGH